MVLHPDGKKSEDIVHILGTWSDVTGLKCEWKVKGDCILTHY